MGSRWHRCIWIAVALGSVAMSGCFSGGGGGVQIVSIVETPRLVRSLRRSDARLLVTSGSKDVGSPSADDLRRDTNLASDIRSLNVFATVEVGRHGVARWCEPLTRLTITRRESSKADQGQWISDVARSAFSFGASSEQVQVREHLTSTVRLELQRWDGAVRIYESAGEAVVERDTGASSEPVRRRLTTRVTWAALKRLTDDAAFYAVAADKLKVTKPHTLKPARVKHLIDEVEDTARPFSFGDLYQMDESADCGDGLCVVSQNGPGPDGSPRLVSRVASPSTGRGAIISRSEVPSIFSPSEIPITSRVLELSNPVALSERTPFGFCEVVVYHHAKNTRTIYTACDQKAWTARIELCRLQ